MGCEKGCEHACERSPVSLSLCLLCCVKHGHGAEGGGRRAGRGGGTLGADMSSVYARVLLDDDQLLVVRELDVAALRLACACLQGLHLFDVPAAALLVHVFLAAASVAHVNVVTLPRSRAPVPPVTA